MNEYKYQQEVSKLFKFEQENDFSKSYGKLTLIMLLFIFLFTSFAWMLVIEVNDIYSTSGMIYSANNDIVLQNELDAVVEGVSVVNGENVSSGQHLLSISQFDDWHNKQITTIFSPTNGSIKNFNLKPGDIFSANTNLLEVIPRENNLTIHTDIPVNELNDFSLGNNAQIVFNKSTFSGNLGLISTKPHQGEDGKYYHKATLIIKNDSQQIPLKSKVATKIYKKKKPLIKHVFSYFYTPTKQG